MSLTERQREIRRTGITATDVRVLAGCDPYGRTPHDVWRAKVLGDEDFRETEATEIGNLLEPIIIPRVASRVKLHALRIDPEKLTMRHPEHPTAIATPDALLAATAFHAPEAAAQIKVCGLETAGDWGDADDGADGIPEHVLVQVAWELYVSQLALEYVGALIGTQIRVYRVDRTRDVDDLIDALIAVADRFWSDHVQPKIAPPVDGSEGSRRMLRAMWPRSDGSTMRASPEAEAAARRYFEAARSEKSARKAKELATQELLAFAGAANEVTGDGWRLRLSERPAVTVPAYEHHAYRHFDCRAVGGKRERAA